MRIFARNRRLIVWVILGTTLISIVTLFNPNPVLEVMKSDTNKVFNSHKHEEQMIMKDKSNQTAIVSEWTEDKTLSNEALYNEPMNKHSVNKLNYFSDYFPYRYLINEPKACDERVEIINIIPVSAGNHQGRFLIRSLWGNQTLLPQTSLKTLFLVGRTYGSRIQHEVEQESHKFHDILQIDFMDSYSNLTLKTLTILHWTKEFCSSARWVLKSDDDVFVNPFALKGYLDKKGRYSDIVCRMNTNLKVCRSAEDCQEKWVISKEKYPHNYYPPYCNGPAYVINARIIEKLYKRADKYHPFEMEDVYFTGIIAKNLFPKYKRFSSRRFPIRAKRIKNNYWNGITVMLIIYDKKRINSTSLWHNLIMYRNGNRTE